VLRSVADSLEQRRPGRFDPRRDSSRRDGSRREGALLSTELLLLLPILLIFLLALVEITFLIVIEARLASAAREGVRVAARGGDSGDIEAAIALIFGNPATSQVTFTVTFPSGTDNTGDPVQVVVSTPATAYVPNYLAAVCFDLTGVTLSAQAVMTIE
jgi:Flp pilus assembly protein TadG